MPEKVPLKSNYDTSTLFILIMADQTVTKSQLSDCYPGCLDHDISPATHGCDPAVTKDAILRQ